MLRASRNLGGTALSNLRNPRTKVADRYDAGRRRAEFRVADLVLVRLYPLSSKSRQRSAKLDYKWWRDLFLL
jgi:hypothetical protein